MCLYRIPELPPVVEGSDAVFPTETFPSFENATPQAVVSGGLRLCSETDSAMQQHVEKLAAQGNYDALLTSAIFFLHADPSKLTFESIFNPIEDWNVPFETGFYTIRQLALVKQRVFPKLFSKVSELFINY